MGEGGLVCSFALADADFGEEAYLVFGEGAALGGGGVGAGEAPVGFADLAAFAECGDDDGHVSDGFAGVGVCDGSADCGGFGWG